MQSYFNMLPRTIGIFQKTDKFYVKHKYSSILQKLQCRFNSGSVDGKRTVYLSNGRSLELSTGKYARFTNGTGICSMGDTTVMVTAVSSMDKRTPGSFMPLTVEYRQKYAAAGRIPTNFLRRELGPTEKEILTSRLIDRSLRPLFPAGFRYETQLICNILAIDSNYSPDVLSINAASLALAMSDIPWNGPVAAVRVGLVNDEAVVNPTRLELQSSDLDLIVTGTKNKMLIMLEGKGNMVQMDKLLNAVKKGLGECQTIIRSIGLLQAAKGKPKRLLDPPVEIRPEITSGIKALCEMRLYETFQNQEHDKLSRDQMVNSIRDDAVDRLWTNFPDVDRSLITDEFNRFSKEIFRSVIFQDKRCDGRNHNNLRPISCEVDLYSPLHGSALFQRGQTQVMATVSLDSIESAMKIDPISALDVGVKSKNFFLHYEFPPYATGEIKRVGPLGRREIGHGALAEKALVPIIPPNYPFTIRLTSEVLESNGSSSMATVCAGSLALLDAGVPLIEPAAGVAIGLVTKYSKEDENKLDDYRILTDILGIEDYLGDMDLKVAGTERGITAIQADIKTNGVPIKIISEALSKAHNAKSKILKIMKECILLPRTGRKHCWPVTETLSIDPQQRSRFIGPGGINMKKIFLETGAHITQVDEGQYSVFAPSEEAMNEAKEYIKDLFKEDDKPDLEFGGIYTAKIVDIMDVGVMVTLYPKMQPVFIHLTQLDNRKVANPAALGYEIGQEFQIKYFGTDPVTGYMRLSRKAASSLSDVTKHNFAE